MNMIVFPRLSLNNIYIHCQVSASRLLFTTFHLLHLLSYYQWLKQQTSHFSSITTPILLVFYIPFKFNLIFLCDVVFQLIIFLVIRQYKSNIEENTSTVSCKCVYDSIPQKNI